MVKKVTSVHYDGGSELLSEHGILLMRSLYVPHRLFAVFVVKEVQ